MEAGRKGAGMADETQDEIQRRLLKLHGQMMAFAEAVRVIGEESAKVAAFDGAGPEDPDELRLASAEAVAALSLDAVRAWTGPRLGH